MILVTGGTGLLGSHLLFRLLEQGRPIRAIYRKGSDLKRVERVFGHYSTDPAKTLQRIQWVEADLNDLPALEEAFEGVVQVYHCAAYISFDPRDYDQLYRINVTGTANIVNLCLDKKVRKLCYSSSIAAIGKSAKRQLADEGNEWHDTHANVYALTKTDAELEVWRASQENLAVVIVNPGIIIGPGFWETGSGRLFPTANREPTFYPPGGTGFVSVNDVVTVMVRLMESGIHGERFVLVAENLRYGEALERICRALGKKPPSKQLPFWALSLLWRLDRIYAGLTGKKRKLTKNTVLSLRNMETYSSEKVQRMLEIKWEPLEGAIAFSAEKFLQEQSTSSRSGPKPQ